MESHCGKIFQSGDKDYQEISQVAKDIVEIPGNLEAHEILMITDTVLCKFCYNYATLGHTIANVDIYSLEQVTK